MICPSGFNVVSGVNGEYCVNAQGYSLENIQATEDIARNRCKSQMPMLLGLGAGILFLPGYWKILPLVFLPIYLGSSEFGGPGCSYFLRK